MNSDVYLDALAQLAEQHHENGAYGILLIGLPDFSVRDLAERLGGPEEIAVSLIGVDGADEIVDWAREQGWGEARFGSSVDATHAVGVRNDDSIPDDVIRLAITQGNGNRQHSLESGWYRRLGTDEVIQEVCRLGAQNAPNQPQEYLWRALATEEVASYLSLKDVINYYEALFEAPDAEPVETPRQKLPLLHLLKDPTLLTGAAGIRQRLEANARMVERLQQPDDKDEEHASINARRDELALKNAYKAFTDLRRGDQSAIADLTFPEAERLFAKPTETPGSTPAEDVEDGAEGDSDDTEPAAYGHPAQAAVDLAELDDATQLGKLVDAALLPLTKDRPGKRQKIETKHATFDFTPDPHAMVFTRVFIGEERYGGTLYATDETLDGILTGNKPGYHIDQESCAFFDDIRIQKLQRYMTNAEELDPDFKGGELLGRYLTRRAVLTRAADFGAGNDSSDDHTLTHADVLANEQLAFAYLAGRPSVLKAASTATDAYQRLLSHLAEHFHILQEASPRGAARIYGEILALDLITIKGRDGDTGALLSPISPLVLWKHIALAELVKERSKKLEAADRELLHEELSRMPEPLLALYAPSFEDEADGLELIYAGRVGSLPLYRSSVLDTNDVSASGLRRAAEKLAALYPPAKENLRVVLLNPRSIAPAAQAARRLLTQKRQFKHVTIMVAHLGIKRKQNNDWLSLDLDLDELYAEGKVTLETIPAASVDGLAEHLRDQPAHLLAVAGQKHRRGSAVRQETTRLHPLSIPKRLEADGITGAISLQPRSNRPPEGQPHHPYGLYHSVVSALTRKPRRDHTMREHQHISLADQRPLLACAPFYVLAGVPKEGAGDDVLRLTQGGGLHGDAVFTQFKSRILRSTRNLLTQNNYVPTQEGIDTLLRRIEEVGGEGLFGAITAKGRSGFSEKKLKGHIGLAVALGWYEAQAAGGQYLVLSLDSALARQWLGQREEGHRADLLGFRRMVDGTLSVDVIEVKSYAATGEDRVTESQAARQLGATADVLRNMLDRQGDLLIDCRRELLRIQVYREGLLNRREKPERSWVQALNGLLDGEVETGMNQMLVEVHLQENKSLRDETFENDEQTIRRVQLFETAIQEHLAGILAPPETVHEGDGARSAAVNEPVRTAQVDHARPPRSKPLDETVSHSAATRELAGVRDESDNSSDEVLEAREETSSSRSVAETTESDRRLVFAPDASERKRIAEMAKSVYKALEDYRVNLAEAVDPEQAEVGPNIVRYKVRLQPGESVSRVRNVAADLMRELAIRKEPMVGNLPGTSFIHVDVPRPERQVAPLRPVLDAAAERQEASEFSVPVGVEPGGAVRWLSIPKLPHMLVAGATGSGKSVFLRSLIVSLAYLHKPEVLQLVLVDPKRTDFGLFNRLPHLRGAGGVISDPQEAISALNQLINKEMEVRTQTLEDNFYMDIHSFNDDHPDDRIPPIIVVIDEFADLSDVMETGDQREEFDHALRRLAQRARSVGIHLIIATQRPTADIVSGTIKANLPCRVSFRLESNVDSRTVLDQGGAENLLGEGDMMLRHAGQTTRLQGFFLSQNDLRDVLLEIA